MRNREQATVLAVALIACAAASLPAQDDGIQEVVENHPDGSVKARYKKNAAGQIVGKYIAYYADGTVEQRSTWSKGKLHGSYEAYHGNGTRSLLTAYREGLLHGSYQKTDPDSHKLEVAHYKEGKLDGKRQLFAGQEIVSTQVWKEGLLKKLEGIEPFPRTVQEITRTITEEIPGLPMPKPRSLRKPPAYAPPDPDPKSEQRVRALRRLQEYRYLSGVPYEEMWLDPEKIVCCDAAAEVFRLNGEISHHPTRPKGCDDTVYVRGQLGAGHSNIHSGPDMVHSVDSYMDDSDPRNLDKGVGHRQWCLNPQMLITGFGSSAGGSAMWAHDRSRLRLPKSLAIWYPAPGYYPVGHFGPGHAWSVNLHPYKFGQPSEADLKVSVFELDADYRRGKALEIDFCRVFDGPNAFTPCLVFRPVGVRVAAGARYWVVLEVRKQKKWQAMEHLVEFFDLSQRTEK